VQISERAVRRRLKQAELGSYIPARAPKLEVRHRVARLAFGHENENWNIDQWGQVLFTIGQVLFTDGSPFCVNTIDGRKENGDVEENDNPNVISKTAFWWRLIYGLGRKMFGGAHRIRTH
jgi:hypothetical protein